MDLSHTLENLLGDNVARILRRLATVNDGLSGRRIAEVADVPVASTSRVLADLVDVGLITSSDVGRSRLYRLNRAHVLWDPLERMLATPAQIEQLIAESVRTCVGGRATVAIFGSFARGDAGRRSDMDVVIVWDDSVSDDERFAALDALYDSVPAATGNRLEVIELKETDLCLMVEAHDPLIESWLRDARTVAGLELKTRLREAVRS